jgi:maltose-binding protein MalE
MGVKNDGINIKIYDKPKKYNSRTLLYEKDNVSGSEFTIETTEMVEKLITNKREKGVSEEVLNHLRIKKLYIDYLIPATERDIQVDDQTGEEYKLVTKGAIILAVGYHNL